MKKTLIGIFIALIIIVSPTGLAMAEEYQPVDIAAPSLLVNGSEVQPDDQGNYLLTGNGDYAVSAGAKIAGNLIIAGVGAWLLESNLDISGQITVLEGTLNTMGNHIVCDSFYIGEYGKDTAIMVDVINSTINCFAFGIRGNGVDFKSGGSTINTTLLFDNSAKTGHVYNTVTISRKDTVFGFVEGNSIFGKLVFDSVPVVYISQNLVAQEVELKNGSLRSVKTSISIDTPTKSYSVTTSGLYDIGK